MVENSQQNKSPSKIDLDRPQDFKFRIAYEVYSQAWEDNTSESARAKLNELLSSLGNNENGYSAFYSQIREYRKDLTSFTSGHTRIETQRKRAWQESDNRDRRNRRHR